MRLVTFSRRARGPRAGALIDDGTRVLDLQAAQRACTAGPRPDAGERARDRRGRRRCARPRARARARSGARAGARRARRGAARTRRSRSRRRCATSCASRSTSSRPSRRRASCARAAAPDPDAALAEMEAKGILAVPQTWYERPIFYHPNRFSVCGHEDDVPWPGYSDSARLRARVRLLHRQARQGHPARSGRATTSSATRSSTTSRRATSRRRRCPASSGRARARTSTTRNAMGPCLVTADEIPDPYALEMKVRVNGEEWGRGNSRDMKLEVRGLHRARRRASETLHPGRVLRLRHRRRRLRARAAALPEARRRRRARGRAHRRAAQPRGEAVSLAEAAAFLAQARLARTRMSGLPPDAASGGRSRAAIACRTRCTSRSPAPGSVGSPATRSAARRR